MPEALPQDKEELREDDLQTEDVLLKRKRKLKQVDKVDADKIAEKAKLARVLKYDFPEEDKVRWSFIQSHPLKIIITGVDSTHNAEELLMFFREVLAAEAPELAAAAKDVTLDAGGFAVLEVANRRAKEYFRQHADYTFAGTALRLRKPKNYFEERYRDEKAKRVDQGNKIFMGGIPFYFEEPTVRSICETFGRLKQFSLSSEMGVCKGYCFFQYEDPRNSENAIKALNNLAVGDRRLRVQKAASEFKHEAQQVNTRPSNFAGTFMQSYENYFDPQVQMTIRIPPQSAIPSRVLQLLNMCYPEDLFDDQFYHDLVADVQEETSKYGMVEDIVVPRPDPKTGYTVPSVGKVFVKFMYIIPAKRARQAISGRIYNRRTCIASFYPEERFDLREFLLGY